MRARQLLRDTRGAAAAEMALVAPLLLALMFGSFELGNYFYNNHIVIKAVRDGARYASRRSFTDFSCPGVAPSDDAVTAITNVTRTGQIASGGSPRLFNWEETGTVNVTMTCTSNDDDGDQIYAGIYDGRAHVPVVNVSAVVPYSSMFADMIFDESTLSITAESQVPVMGI